MVYVIVTSHVLFTTDHSFLARLNVVFSNIHRCGFFIDVESFHEMFMRPCLMGDQTRPAPSLLNAFYLWAVYLSPALSITHGLDESMLLRCAQNNISKDLSSTHPFRVVHVMQAEILLSYYFLEHGRVLQGNYHANSALALSLSSGCYDVCIPWASNAGASLSPPEWNTGFAPPENHLYTGAFFLSLYSTLVADCVSMQELCCDPYDTHSCIADLLYHQGSHGRRSCSPFGGNEKTAF